MNFPSTRPTLASEINVSEYQIMQVPLMLLNLLMHLALHLRHMTLMDHHAGMVIIWERGRNTRSTNLIVNTSLSLGLASLLKPPENVLLQILVIYR
jgi:hypothetical protein